MKKLLIIITIIIVSNLNLNSQNFKVAGNFNNWAAEQMNESSVGSGIYKLSKTLSSGTYEYQTTKDDIWTLRWQGVNRPFTINQNKKVTFYARKEGYSNENGKDWLFFCDAQDFYLCGDVVGSWDNLNTVKKMTVSGTKATYQGYLNAGSYQVRINSQYGLVDNDVMIFANTINQAGNYRIELDFETMLATAYALRLNTTLNPTLLIGSPITLKNCTTDGFQNSIIDVNYGDSFMLGAELTTRPVSSDVAVKLHYTLGTVPIRTGTIDLNWVSDHTGIGSDYDSKWRTSISTNIVQGLPVGKYSLEFHFTASDGVHTYTNQYNSDYHYRIYLNIKDSKQEIGPIEVNLPTDQNYIMNITPLDQTATVNVNNGVINIDNGGKSVVNVQYFDGFGRPDQTIQVGITSGTQRKDLVTLQTYDSFGREKAAWLPIPNAGKGKYIQTQDSQELENMFMNYYSSDNPFSYPVYESSPMNRVVEQYAPGKEWHSKGKSVKTKYLSNSSDYPCKLFKITADGNNVVTSGNYLEKIFVIEATDEDGNLSYEFKDKLGQVILTRQINNNQNYDTYYVYDDFNNLSFVLPPLAADDNGSAESINLYGYKYKYDGRQRCIEKKLPGCEPIYYVYDKADQMILSQNGEQRKVGEWVFNKYDEHGRLIITGIYLISLSHDQLRTKYKDIVVKEKFDKYNKFGYTWNTISEVYYDGVRLVNHYDDYEHLLTQVEHLRSQMKYVEKSEFGKMYINSSLGSASAKGLLTGIREVINGDINKQIITAYYYDEQGRIIQSNSTNHQGGYDNEYILYNFTGQQLKRRLEHTAPNKTSKAVNEDYIYTYDYAGRLSKTEHSFNGSPLMTLSENEYDELGRLIETKTNNQTNLTTKYAYNIRSWTKSISSPLFQQTLYYNETYNNNKPQYNGNISAMTVIHNANAGFGYAFEYDNKSQLTSSKYFNPRTLGYATNTDYTTSYRYDKHGNVETLQRGIGMSLNIRDNVSFDYVGNQLKRATNNAATYITGNFTDYADEFVEYEYNANGAITVDKNKGVTTSYDLYSGMPKEVKVYNPVAKGGNDYMYTSSGQKLQVRHIWSIPITQTPLIGTMLLAGDVEVEEDIDFGEGTLPPGTGYAVWKTIDYAGNLIFESGNAMDTKMKILIENGYIEDGNYYFYLKDHLGNNRVVADANGAVVQWTDYYPFGKPSNTVEEENGKQPYKYNGKEYDTMHGLNILDYHARWLDPSGIRFTRVDPLAEKYYSISPYVYCANNPIRNIDPDGMDYWSTSDPEEIRKFMTAYGGTTKPGAQIFNYGNWDYLTDIEVITAVEQNEKLVFNDNTNMFHLSVATMDKDSEASGGFSIGVKNISLSGIKVPFNDGWGSVKNNFYPQGGRIEQTNTEFWLLLGGTRVGYSLLKELWRSMSSANPTTNTFDASKSGFASQGGGKNRGERNYASKASGTNNPFKHMRPDPNKPGNVLIKNPQTGKWVSKPAPPGYPGTK